MRFRYFIFICVVLGVFAVWLGGHFLSLGLSHRDPSQRYFEQVESRVQDSMWSLERSLVLQAEELGSSSVLIESLKDVREQLSTRPIAELKQLTQNRWNSVVFGVLLDWHQQCEAQLKRGDEGFKELNRWGRVVDVVLGFSYTPLKDGKFSNILVAHGKRGMELQGGLAFDSLDLVNAAYAHKSAAVGLLGWESKMYIAVVEPILGADGVILGSVVLGYELGSDVLSVLLPSVDEGDGLLFCYFGEGGVKDRAERCYGVGLSQKLATYLEGPKFIKEGLSGKFGVLEMIKDSDLEDDVYVYNGHWLKTGESILDYSIVLDIDQKDALLHDFWFKFVLVCFIVVILVSACVFLLLRLEDREFDRFMYNVSMSVRNQDRRFDFSELGVLRGKLGKLAVILERFGGEDEVLHQSGEGWSSVMVDLDDGSSDGAGEELSGQDEGRELKSLYEEYILRREQEGISNKDMDFQKFSRRLLRNKEQLLRNYDCRDVNFHVDVVGGKVILKPELIR